MLEKIKVFDAALDKAITKFGMSLSRFVTFRRTLLTIYIVSCLIFLFIFFTPAGWIILMSSMPIFKPYVSEGVSLLIVLTALFAAFITIVGTLVLISKAFFCIFFKLKNRLYPQQVDFPRGARERAAGTYMRYVRTASDTGNKVENSIAKDILPFDQPNP